MSSTAVPLSCAVASPDQSNVPNIAPEWRASERRRGKRVRPGASSRANRRLFSPSPCSGGVCGLSECSVWMNVPCIVREKPLIVALAMLQASCEPPEEQRAIHTAWGSGEREHGHDGSTISGRQSTRPKSSMSRSPRVRPRQMARRPWRRAGLHHLGHEPSERPKIRVARRTVVEDSLPHHGASRALLHQVCAVRGNHVVRPQEPLDGLAAVRPPPVQALEGHRASADVLVVDVGDLQFAPM